MSAKRNIATIETPLPVKKGVEILLSDLCIITEKQDGMIPPDPRRSRPYSKSLFDAMSAEGQLQTANIYKHSDGKLYVIGGHQRLKVLTKIANGDPEATMRCDIYEKLGEDQQLVLRLSENGNRSQDTLREQAASIQYLKSDYQWSNARIGATLGIQPGTVSEILRVVDPETVNPQVIDAYDRGVITATTALRFAKFTLAQQKPFLKNLEAAESRMLGKTGDEEAPAVAAGKVAAPKTGAGSKSESKGRVSEAAVFGGSAVSKGVAVATVEGVTLMPTMSNIKLMIEHGSNTIPKAVFNTLEWIVRNPEMDWAQLCELEPWAAKTMKAINNAKKAAAAPKAAEKPAKKKAVEVDEDDE